MKEKNLEPRLKKEIEKLGGLCIKLVALHYTGLPDRLCLFKRGRVCFAEVKTAKKTPSKIQKLVHRKLRELGFEVYVVDSNEIINTIVDQYDN